MAVYYKPQSPIQSGEDFIYPITTADQVMVDEDTRLNAVGVYLENIDNSTDTTVYGNNATTLGGVAAEDYALKTDTAPDSSKLGGVAASDYALKTDTAPDSSKLGGKAPEYYINPRNLLDNSDFRNPVNQRGIASGAAVGSYAYFIDRWINGEESSIAPKLNNNGIKPNGAFYQNLDSLASYVGKKMTFAVGLSSGNVVTASGTLTEATTSDDVFIFDTTDGSNEIAVGSTNGLWYVWIDYPSSTIQWAALYEGSYTAETLPPYVPKGYAAELAECRRYAKRITGVLAGIAHGYQSGKAYAAIFTSGPKMRMNPSVDDYSKIQIINGEWYSDSFTSITGIATIATREDSITFWIESSEISAGKDYYISCDKGALFSADL